MTSCNNVITVELVDGTQVIVPDSLEQITSYVLQEQGDWFEDEIKFLRQIIRPGDSVVDIGANYGVYALSLARKTGAKGQVWAFEPASTTSSLLNKSATANKVPWLQVVRQALSDKEGTAWLEMPGQAELNRLTAPSSVEGRTRTDSGESVATTTLDRCLDTYGWTKVDLLKIDAEGAEERILRGGKRFFHELSPLVMFEVKTGVELRLDLVKLFQELGYQSFRLIPGLNALMPFAIDQQVDDYLLNLFAAKPDRIAVLETEGWLASKAYAMDSESVDSILTGPWLQTLKDKPYAVKLATNWELNAAQLDQRLVFRALAEWSFAQDQDQTTASRSGALTHSLELLKKACHSECSLGRMASLARVALACGERIQAIDALHALLSALQSGRTLDLDEPFLSPDPTFEALTPNGRIEIWLEAASLSAIERFGSFSGFYTGQNSIQRLQRIADLGYDHDLICRRLQLVQLRYQREYDSSQSVRLWFEFLELDNPLRCVDVGALSLQGEVESWVRWAQEECAVVLGFEPLESECEQLNHQAWTNGNSLNYLPLALGDGKEHTLHITNAPMTSSLFPPARSTVDLFPALGELMQVERKVQVQTHRLDDIPEAKGADFLKLDVQGAELMILENAQEVLRSVSVIQCEVEFLELYKGQPLMADIDSFLRTQGFCFHQFKYTMGRSFKPLRIKGNPLGSISQRLGGGAVFIRDFRDLAKWSNRHLKAAAFILHEQYQSFDIALFLIRELDKRYSTDLASSYTAALLMDQPQIDANFE